MNRDTKFYFRLTVVILFGLFILGYSYFQARKLIGGPSLVIESPQNGATLTESLVDIRGTARNVKEVSLNDRPIFTDEEGHFEEKLLVPPGYTIITLKAEDRFGRKTNRSLELYYDAPRTTLVEVKTGTTTVATTSTSTISH